MDKESIDFLTDRIKLAVIEGIGEHERRNKEQLSDLQRQMNQHITDTVNTHAATCPIGIDYKLCKAKLLGFAIGIAGGSSSLTVIIQKLLGY